MATVHLFISHSWSYSDAYERLNNLLDSRPYFTYINYSIPRDYPVHTRGTDQELYEAIRNRMRPCQVVLIMAGVYSTYSKWITKEIQAAKHGFLSAKPIVAVRPWAQINVSSVVTQNADVYCGGHQAARPLKTKVNEVPIGRVMSSNLRSDLMGVSSEEYGSEHGGHLLEQYKLYLEMADRISQRRQTANTFLLTINTALVALLGIALPHNLGVLGTVWYAIVGTAGIVLCYTWLRLVRSYSDLNTAKFKVVHEIEQMLPIRPYEAEWKAVGEGKDPKRYLPFTRIEPRIPWVFAVLYLSLIASSIVSLLVS